jgi:D-amino-acid dehydrogenase
MAGDAHDRVVVIGGGVVGVCCALALQREGRQVVIVERDEPGMGTAIASCGLIAVSEVVPLSKPDILRRAPGWLRGR